MDTGLVLNGKAISLIKINVNSHLNKKQEALLKLLHKCLEENKPLTWETMTKFYIKNVNDKSDRQWDNLLQRYNNGILILPHFKELDDSWIYSIKPRIRQWFATNMGSMILKGSILALPIIELNDN